MVSWLSSNQTRDTTRGDIRVCGQADYADFYYVYDALTKRMLDYLHLSLAQFQSAYQVCQIPDDDKGS